MDWLQGIFHLLRFNPTVSLQVQKLYTKAVQMAKPSSYLVMFPFFHNPQYHHACYGIFRKFFILSSSTTALVLLDPAESFPSYLAIFTAVELSATVESCMFH
jgi:hypothetical protein